MECLFINQIMMKKVSKKAHNNKKVVLYLRVKRQVMLSSQRVKCKVILSLNGHRKVQCAYLRKRADPEMLYVHSEKRS